MTVRGVLFDFSGTLFRLEMSGSWLPGQDTERAGRLLTALTAPTGPATHLPVRLSDEWQRRDLDPEIHRRVYIESLRRSGLTAELAEQGYDRMLDPASWQPYPDVRAALERLREHGLPVAVVSNIAWHVRPVFERAGVADLVTEYVLSYREGSMKPDEKLFRIACDRIGVEPADALMIGDSVEADGGAATIGCPVRIVTALPTADRPHALLDALAEHGL